MTAAADRPWGVRLNGVGSVNGFQNRWEMQGHESEQTFGLNRVNFGARTFNPTIGRFDRTDRFSEKYLGLSTYQYTANNPINFIEINGDSTSNPITAFGMDFNFTLALTRGSSALSGKIGGIPVGIEVGEESDIIGVRDNMISRSHMLNSDGSRSSLVRNFANLDIGIIGAGREQLKVGGKIVSDETHLGLNVISSSQMKALKSTNPSFDLGAKIAFYFGLEVELSISRSENISSPTNNSNFAEKFVPIDLNAKSKPSVKTNEFQRVETLSKESSDRVKNYINSLK